MFTCTCMYVYIYTYIFQFVAKSQAKSIKLPIQDFSVDISHVRPEKSHNPYVNEIIQLLKVVVMPKLNFFQADGLPRRL